MNRRLTAVAATLLFLEGAVASAHRLDEYLQATIISVENEHVDASMRLIPGIAVSSSVIAGIDGNRDGVISEAEQRAYAARVLNDLLLSVDGVRLTLKFVSADFPSVEQMREGIGEIDLHYSAELPRGGPTRRLILENHHQSQNAAYLVNCRVPPDREIHILSQTRNEQQSFYQLDYAQGDSPPAPAVLNWWTNIGGWVRNAGFASLFRLGMRHITEGTDHLLFLLALLLPAPLIFTGSRWDGFAGIRRSLLRIFRVVTAFTIGHSITLALAAWGLVRVPNRHIEVLIAVSILVSAIHALRPLFPGKESGIAAFFGLIHGLAFAATLSQLGLAHWQLVTGILAFNLGIETMQLTVVAITIPSLVLMSRTRAYSFLRIGGALFAGFASIGWIAERLFSLHNPFGDMVSVVAYHATWIAFALFLASLGCWLCRNILNRKATTIPPSVGLARSI